MVHGMIVTEIFGYPISLFAAILTFIWLSHLWATYLDIRQRKTVQSTTEVPKKLTDVLGQKEFEKSKLYSLDKSSYALVHGTYEILQLTAILYFEAIPWLWGKVLEHIVIINTTFEKFNINFYVGQESEIWCSLLFLSYYTIFAFFDSMPWSIYYNFVIEARHGFNKQTFGFFIKDKIKVLILSVVLSFPIVSGLIWIIKIGGPRFYLYAYLFSLVISIFMMFIYPAYIAPLFDKYEELPAGDLRDKIEALAAKINFPLTKLFVVDGSNRSSHSNAYFYGFWKNKRIVLFDTLIRDYNSAKVDKTDPVCDPKNDSVPSVTHGCTDEEVVAVLSHELGHWKLSHTVYNLFIRQANLFVMFFVFGWLINNNSIFESFGFTTYTPVFLRLCIVFQFIFSPYNQLTEFLMTILSRRFEFQADGFAVKLGYGRYLNEALITLHKDNLSFPVSDWLYSWYNYSHPTLLERLSAIDFKISKSK